MKLHRFMKHLRIGIFPTNTTSKLDEIKITEGKYLYVLDGYIIKLLSQILKFSYTALLNTAIGESQSDGNWTGCVGMVQGGKSDIAICSAVNTEERSQVVSFSHSYIHTPITFVTDKPQPLPNSYAMIYAFSWQVWLALLISFLFMSFIIYKLFDSKQTYFKILTRMFGTLTEQSFGMQSRSTCVRLSIISWVIGAMCITYSYKAVILASFSFPHFSGIFDIKDLSEAAKNPSFQCGIRQGSYVYNVLTRSSEKSISVLGDCIRRTPKLQNYDDFLRNSSYKKAAIAGKSYLSMFKKDFFISDDAFFTAGPAVIVNKNFCCTELLNDVILRISEAGLIQKYQDDSEFLDAISNAYTDDANYSPHQILKLTDLHTAFIFLIWGILLSTLVLVIEILLHRFTKNRT